MSDEIIPARIYFKTWTALLALLLVTVGAAYVNLGPLNVAIALAISISKTALIVLFFMHIKWSGRLLHLAAFAGELWQFISWLKQSLKKKQPPTQARVFTARKS